MANTMKFFGSFGKSFIRDTNPIWSFAIGTDFTGWDSEKANNLEQLLQNVRFKNSLFPLNQVLSAFMIGKQQLYISVPTYGVRTDNFNLTVGRKEPTLRISVKLKLSVLTP